MHRKDITVTAADDALTPINETPQRTPEWPERRGTSLDWEPARPATPYRSPKRDVGDGRKMAEKSTQTRPRTPMRQAESQASQVSRYRYRNRGTPI
jgi:hypothetical protein